MCDVSLQWNDHSSIYVAFVSSLLGKNRFSDATIACNGQLYPVHKFVLSVCSNYFNTIFEDTNAAQQHPVLILKDISPDVLEALLKYIYLGHVSIEDAKLADLISAAKSLRIKGLDVPCSQKKSGDGEENVAIAQSISSQEDHGSVTEENDPKLSSPSCQSNLLDSHLGENTASLAVPGGVLNSDEASHEPSHVRQGGGKARRGRPIRHSSKRFRSQRDSSPGFPPAKKSSQDLLLQTSPLPNPCAATAEPQNNNPDAATAPSLPNIPANLGLNDASIAPLEHEGLAGILQSLLYNAPVPVIVETANDPSFPALQPPACRQQQQKQHQPAVHPESVANSPSSSLRSFRLPGRTPGARQPLESRLADIRIAPEERLDDSRNPKPVFPSFSSSFPKIRVIPEEKLLPSRNELTKVRIVPESRLCCPTVNSVHPEPQPFFLWNVSNDENGENQAPSHSGEEPSKTWELSSSSSTQLDLPIITSCYSVLPSTSEHSPSTSEVADPPHLPLISLTSVDPQPASLETSPQIVQPQQIEELGMELSVSGQPSLIQPPSEVTTVRHDASQDLTSSHKVKHLEVALKGNRLNPSSPIKPCSVKLTRMSPNISDSVIEVGKGQSPKIDKMFKCLKCNFLTLNQIDFLKHTNISCSSEERPAGSVSEQNCSGSSKSNVSAGDNSSMGETSATVNYEDPTHPGEVYKCKLCNAEYQKRNCMLEHQKIHRVSKKLFKCPNCEYLTTSKSRLQHHIKNRKSNALNRCTFCNYTACTPWLMRIHLYHELGDVTEGELALDNPVVDAKSKKKASDSSKRVKKYSCHTCQGLFPSYCKLTKHELQTGHGSDKPFGCNLCKFRSVSQGAVKNHMRRHVTKATYTCKLCSYSCEAKHALDKHLLVDHEAINPANVNLKFLATPLKPAELEVSAAGSQSMECIVSEPLSNESENSNELGLSFNVEEFQQECLNKLKADEITRHVSKRFAPEIILLSDTEKHQENNSLDNPLTLKVKSIEIPVNSIPNLEEASGSDHILSQSEKQVKKDGHQAKDIHVSCPADIPYSHQKQENKILNITLIQAEQKDELLIRPQAQHEHNTELLGRSFLGKDQEKEELNKPLGQDDLIKQKEYPKFLKNPEIETANRVLELYVLDDELLGDPLSEIDQESEALNMVQPQHRQVELLDRPLSEKQLNSEALGNVLPQSRQPLDSPPSEKQLESEVLNKVLPQCSRDEPLDRPLPNNQLDSEASNKILPQRSSDELLGRSMSENQLESEAINRPLTEHGQNNGLQERPLSKLEVEDKTLDRSFSQHENRDK